MYVLTANRLSDGVVLWLSASGWSEDAADATRLAEEDAKAALANWVKRETEVVGAYLIPMETADRPVRRESLRETIRANGPTTGPTQFDTATRRKRERVF